MCWASQRAKLAIGTLVVCSAVVTLGAAAVRDPEDTVITASQRFTGVARVFKVDAGSEQAAWPPCGGGSDAGFVLVSGDHFDREGENEEARCDRCVVVASSGGTEWLRIRGRCHECKGAGDVRVSSDAFARLAVPEDAGSQGDVVPIEWAFILCHKRHPELAGANATSDPPPDRGSGSGAGPIPTATPQQVATGSARPPVSATTNTPIPTSSGAPASSIPSTPCGDSTNKPLPTPPSTGSPPCSPIARIVDGSSTQRPSCEDSATPATPATPSPTPPQPLPSPTPIFIGAPTPSSRADVLSTPFVAASPRPTSNSRLPSPALATGDAVTTTTDKSVNLNAVGATTTASSLRRSPASASPSPAASTTSPPQKTPAQTSPATAATAEEPYESSTSGSSTGSARKSSRGPIAANDPVAPADSSRRRETLLKNPFFLLSVLLAVAGAVGSAVAYRAKQRRHQRHATQHAAWSQYSQRVQLASTRNQSVGTPSPGGVRGAYANSSTTPHSGRSSALLPMAPLRATATL